MTVAGVLDDFTGVYRTACVQGVEYGDKIVVIFDRIKGNAQVRLTERRVRLDPNDPVALRAFEQARTHVLAVAFEPRPPGEVAQRRAAEYLDTGTERRCEDARVVGGVRDLKRERAPR